MMAKLPLLKWPKRIAKEWLEWHASNGRASLLLDSGGNAEGLAVARCVDQIQDAANYYSHSETGSILWVDLLIGLRRIVWPEFCRMALNRFGVRRHVGFARTWRSNSEPRLYPFSILTRQIA